MYDMPEEIDVKAVSKTETGSYIVLICRFYKEFVHDAMFRRVRVVKIGGHLEPC